jgi:curved DNA-binding protein CbpA
MTTGSGDPSPDLYQLLGVAPAASGEQITRAWRQRARAEHPDARPRAAAAPPRSRPAASGAQGDFRPPARSQLRVGPVHVKAPGSTGSAPAAGKEDRLAWLLPCDPASRREWPW